MTNNIFVYGTLMRGHHNHQLLEDCDYLCKAVVPGSALVDLGGCPGMVFARSDFRQWAKGEVYQVGDTYDADEVANVLARLDRLESEGSFYKRVIIDAIPLFHGEPFYVSPRVCHTYIYMPAFDAEFVEGGNWEMPPLGRALPSM